MPPQFSWLTFVQAKDALASRLANLEKNFWVDAELGIYIFEALRTWNALTNTWSKDFDLTADIVNGQTWYKLSGLADYPRVRTVTDADVITTIAYHLLENPALILANGGTGQFALADMTVALQRRRDEILQLTGCNIDQISIASVIGSRKGTYPDNVLAPLRTRFAPSAPGSKAVTLWRDDDLAFQYFSPGYLQKPASLPEAYGVITGPPLQFNVNIPPAVAGNYDVLVLRAGGTLDPQGAPSILPIPDDFTWIAKWGAMADLLGMESEATDVARAAYCLQRYRDGLLLMAQAPWILLATVDGEPVDTVSVQEMDDYALEWEQDETAPACVVFAGTDFAGVSPVPQDGANVVLTIVQNAPLIDGGFLQVSRDSFDPILDLAQHLASFKQGGMEFLQTKELVKNFLTAAGTANSRIKELGLYSDLLLGQGERQNQIQPKYEEEDDE